MKSSENSRDVDAVGGFNVTLSFFSANLLLLFFCSPRRVCYKFSPVCMSLCAAQQEFVTMAASASALFFVESCPCTNSPYSTYCPHNKTWTDAYVLLTSIAIVTVTYWC